MYSELQSRRLVSQEKYRLNNIEGIKLHRNKRNADLKKAVDLARQLGKMARYQQAKDEITFHNNRRELFQLLYGRTSLVTPEMHPKAILMAHTEVNLDHFAYFVALYIPIFQWPRSVNVTEAQPGVHYPLLQQIPGASLFRALSLQFHTDKEPARTATSTRPVRRTGGLNSRISTLSSAIRGDDILPDVGLGGRAQQFRLEPDQELLSLLIRSWRLWETRINAFSPLDESFVLTGDVRQVDEFAAKSEAHNNIMQCFRAWSQAAVSMMPRLAPNTLSLAQLHHFAVAPRKEIDEDVEKEDYDWVVVESALNLPGKGKPGRKKQTFESESEFEEDPER
jgi:hypothetical protein